MSVLLKNKFTKESQFFRALAHPVRYGIVTLLLEGEQRVSDLQRRLKQRQPLISQHLMILRNAGMVKRRKEKRYCWYSLN